MIRASAAMTGVARRRCMAPPWICAHAELGGRDPSVVAPSGGPRHRAHGISDRYTRRMTTRSRSAAPPRSLSASTWIRRSWRRRRSGSSAAPGSWWRGPRSCSGSAISCRSRCSTSRSSSRTASTGSCARSTTSAGIGQDRSPSAKGNRKSLQCRYHGWTYGLDGTLRACPEMEETEDFRKEDFGLMPVRVETWGPFVFVNLDRSAPPLAGGAGRHSGRGGARRLRRRRACGWSSGATTWSSATGRCTSTTTWRAITSRSRTRSSSRSSTTTPTGSRSSATTRSSTPRSVS